MTEVINSFQTENRKGIPLGNLTSQIFANIYLNQLDQFVKHVLKVKYYIRYADDFIILDSNQEALNRYTCILAKFLKEKLKLDLHPQKVNIRKFSWGIDFLGYVVLPFYILQRRKTKRRIFRKIKSRIQAYQNKQISDYSLNQTIQSYLGHLSHANTYKFRQKLLQQ